MSIADGVQGRLPVATFSDDVHIGIRAQDVGNIVKKGGIIIRHHDGNGLKSTFHDWGIL